jgi:hypothetical protein
MGNKTPPNKFRMAIDMPECMGLFDLVISPLDLGVLSQGLADWVHSFDTVVYMAALYSDTNVLQKASNVVIACCWVDGLVVVHECIELWVTKRAKLLGKANPCEFSAQCNS